MRVEPVVLFFALFVLIPACAPRHSGDGHDATAAALNVVVICIDTVRYDAFYRLEALGVKDHFDDWRERGVLFEAVQSAAPWTLPSVASVLTGLYPNNHGAGRFGEAVHDLSERNVPTPLSAGVPTIADDLRPLGYLSAGFSSNYFVDRPFGLINGFAAFSTLDSDEHVVRAARNWIDHHGRATPFLLYVHLTDAHGIFERSDADLAKGADALRRSIGSAHAESLCPSIPDGTDRELCLRYQNYVRGVLQLRASVASILDELDSRHLTDRSVVVLFSDHGEEFHDHAAEEANEAVDPRRFYGIGHGQSLYQELLHVPVVIWHPDVSPRQVTTPLSLVDIAPTILDWVGAERSGLKLDGQSFANLEHLAQDPAFEHRPLASSGIAYGIEEVSILEDGQKWIESIEPSRVVRFDMDHDPGEHSPRAVTTDDAGTARLLASYASDLRKPTSVTTLRGGGELLRKLRSLGYLGSSSEHGR